MASVKMFCILGLLVLGLAMTESDLASGSSSSCKFPAIYNLGNSNSDIGGRSSAFTQFPPPYGKTNLSNPPKRLSDGHVILHFMRMIEKWSRISLPHPDDFSKALYTFDIGQNDLAFGLQRMMVDQIVAAIPGVLNGFDAAGQELCGKGARSFWIYNTGPIGRLPFMALPYNGTLDQNGCVAYQNNVAQEFNQQLKERVNQLRSFVDPLNYCCGSFTPTFVSCGTSVQVNGSSIHGDACGDPQHRISWDGIHYTDAANSRGCFTHPQWFLI